MGTRSRIIIKRRNHDIYLWKHFDGYYDAVGREICYGIFDLLEKYTIKYIQKLIEEIRVDDIEEYSSEEQYIGFDTLDLNELIEGNTKWFMDTSDDINFEYTIDVYNKIIIGEEIDGSRIILTFDEIKKKINFIKKEEMLHYQDGGRC